LIRRPGHDATLASFGPTIGAYHHDGRTKILDEMPALPSDSEHVEIIADIPKYLYRRVMLEEQIHLNGYPSNVLEHG
jgi:hypothetical protein